jgi:hypothetical protein
MELGLLEMELEIPGIELETLVVELDGTVVIIVAAVIPVVDSVFSTSELVDFVWLELVDVADGAMVLKLTAAPQSIKELLMEQQPTLVQ